VVGLGDLRGLSNLNDSVILWFSCAILETEKSTRENRENRKHRKFPDFPALCKRSVTGEAASGVNSTDG